MQSYRTNELLQFPEHKTVVSWSRAKWLLLDISILSIVLLLRKCRKLLLGLLLAKLDYTSSTERHKQKLKRKSSLSKCIYIQRKNAYSVNKVIFLVWIIYVYLSFCLSISLFISIYLYTYMYMKTQTTIG